MNICVYHNVIYLKRVVLDTTLCDKGCQCLTAGR